MRKTNSIIPSTKLLYGSVLQTWVQYISWMKQAVLLAAFRNCDTMGAEGPHKTLIRGIRMCSIRSSYPSEKLSSGFVLPLPDEIKKAAKEFLDKEWDRFPIHFVSHIMHAAEVLCYHHSNKNYREAWSFVYLQMVRDFHLKPETYVDFDKRLSGDIEFIQKSIDEEK